ncbi:MAG: enoyl-CoA hydratase-related protein [Actinomycetota bacterium]
MTDTVLVEPGAITVVSINRPEVHNCVDSTTADALEAAVRAFDADDDARVLILRGAGGAAFSSGFDLKSVPRRRAAGPMGITRMRVSKPTVAAVTGYCLAGGLELACWCDWRICDADAQFGVVNRRWGVPLIDGGTQRLPRIVGLGNALYLIETGARIDAATAHRMGLVQEVVRDGAVLARARELAGHIAGYPQASLRADRASALALDGLDAEAERGEATLESPEMATGLARFRSGDRPEPPSVAE